MILEDDGYDVEAFDDSIEKKDTAIDENLCIICQKNVKKVVFLPCKDLVICSACIGPYSGRYPLQDKCPKCSLNFVSVIETK